MNQTKVYQTIIYGSLYEAFYNKFVNIHDVLDFLLKYEPESKLHREKVCIAYRIVCIFTKEQTIDGEHFICLTENEDFICIYALSFNSHFKEKTYISFDQNLEISKKIQKVLPKLIEEDTFSRFFYVLCDIINNVKIEEAILTTFTRNVRNLINFNHDYAYFLHSDYLYPLENIDQSLYVNDLSKRCLYLQEKAPLYWENVAHSLYYSFVKDKFRNAPNFTKEMIQTYHEIFPKLFPENILNRSEIVLQISNLNKNLQAYLLGFPIHNYIPNDLNLNKALEKLQELGTDKYCKYLSEKSKKDNVSNETNVLSEKIEEFNSFDVVEYYVDEGNTDTHLFQFTRSEFKNILKDGKNFYTGEPLPAFLIEKIKCRNNIAKKYNLPNSKTLNDFLTDLNNNLEYEEDSEKYFVGRARNQETGEESNFRIQIDDLEDLDTEELDEMAEDLLSFRGLDFLGRLTCSCPDCDNTITDRYDEDEECLYDDIESL